MRIAQADLVRVLARLTAQLRPSEVTLLVDTTICAGLACNASWIGEHLGVAAQAYSVRDVVERWPAARWQERLLGLGTADANASRHDVEVGCWAAQRVAMWLDALLGLTRAVDDVDAVARAVLRRQRHIPQNAVLRPSEPPRRPLATSPTNPATQ